MIINSLTLTSGIKIHDCMTKYCPRYPQYQFIGYMPSFSFYSEWRIVILSIDNYGYSFHLKKHI